MTNSALEVVSARIIELKAELSALEKQAEGLRIEARSEVAAQIRALMSAHGLTTADLQRAGLGGTRVASVAKTRKPRGPNRPAREVRDGAGNVWSGRGRRPGWVQAAVASGKSIESMRV